MTAVERRIEETVAWTDVWTEVWTEPLGKGFKSEKKLTRRNPRFGYIGRLLKTVIIHKQKKCQVHYKHVLARWRERYLC